MPRHRRANITLVDHALAWGVHLFTASGAVWGLLAVVAIFDQQWGNAFGWMGLTVVIDAFDGMLARRFRVKQVLPGFDGALLDNMIDYFTYVLVPALFVYEAGLVPPGLRLAALAAIALSSGYQFSQGDAKTDDHFFTGFPSYWNIVVFYLFLLRPPGEVGFGVLLLCAVLVFVPIRYVYPSRTVRFQKLTLFLSVLWGIGVVTLLVDYPQVREWLLWATLGYIGYYLALSLFFTAQAQRRRARPAK